MNALTLSELVELYLRPWSDATRDGQGNLTATWNPPLSAAEQTTFTRLVNMAKSNVIGITPAEWEAIEPDIAGLQTYQNLASPTLAQTVLAVKAQSRILRALLRN